MLNPNHKTSQSNLAKAIQLHNLGQLDDAARAYERLAVRGAKDWEPRYLLGLLRFQQGELAVAQRWLSDATRLNARHADGWFYLGESLAAQGQLQDAEAAYAKASTPAKPHAMASFKLAMLLEAKGAIAKAVQAYRQALAAQANFPEALNNLGCLLQATRDVRQAETLLRQALQCRSDFEPAYINLAGLLSESSGSLQASIDLLRTGVRACPKSADLQFHLAVMLVRAGQSEAAVSHYGEALALNPEHAHAYNNLGVLFLEEGFIEEARVCFERAIAQAELVEAYNNLGNLLTQLEQFDAALAAFERAIALRPQFADPYNGSGLVLCEQGAVAHAVQRFRDALERKAFYPEAAANLGAALHRLADLPGARQAYDESLRMAPSPALRIKASLTLPPIARSREELLQSRQRLERELDALLAADLHTTEQDLLRYPDVSFYLAYHGMNDRVLMEKRAQLFAACCPSLLYRAGHVDALDRREGPIRIGFVSRFFYNHSVGNFFNPIIEHLARDQTFEVYLFGIGSKQDGTLRGTAEACHEYVMLPPRSLPGARQAIEERALDILVYADIGMDPFAYLLSFSRLARKQCVLQGHSVTSGVPSLDYFVSSRLIEPPDAQDQYSEQLVLLDELPMILPAYPPLRQSFTRTALGLPANGRLYICPMKLHKIHPDMDGLVAGILEKDPQGHVIFFAQGDIDSWTLILRERLAQVMSSSNLERVVFLPFESNFERFRAIMAAADVALDTPHHSGGTTTNICISVGTPIVSWVGATCRGRGPQVFYGMMGLSDGIVSEARDYVEAAVGIANDVGRRAQLSAEILERAPRLLRNPEVLEAYRDLFRRMPQDASLPASGTGGHSAPHQVAIDAVSVPSMQRAIELHQAGEFARAHETYLQLLSADPTCADAWHLLGVIALQIKDTATALTLIAHAIELDPRQALYFTNLGSALFAQSKFDDAERMYRQAIALQSDCVEAIYNLGNTLQVVQRYDEALACYQQAVAHKPAYTDALFSAAALFEAQGDYATARDWYRRLLAVNPSHAEAYLHLGRRLFQQGDIDEGVAHYQEYRRLCQPQPPNTKDTPIKLLALTSVKQWCARSMDRYEQVRPAREQQVEAPRFSQPPAQEIPACNGALHELYLAEIRHATVIGWHDPVLSDCEQTALYDMATRNADDAIEVEHRRIRYAARSHLLMDELPRGKLAVDHGVLIAGRGRDSFAHWVIDFLPRLWILDQFSEYANWPLLVDAGLYPQQIESLQALNKSARPLVVLSSDTAYEIDRVVQISDLSGMRRQSYRPLAQPRGDEVVVAPEALEYLRQAFAPSANLSNATRKLYVSRLHQSQFRRLENEADIESLFRWHGFEVIYPEQHTFAEQVRLFSEARIVAGAAGSNMINTVFSPRGARILMLAQWHPRLNYYFFSHLAQLSSQRLQYVLGDVTRRHALHYQNDFVVDLPKIEHALANCV